MTGQPLISNDLKSFLESGLSINVASRDDELQANGVVAWAVRVHEDRNRLTIYLHKEAGRDMLRNLTTHPEIAVAFDLPTSHRACQIKGLFVSTRPARASERAEIERQVDRFFADMESIGIPRAMVSGLKTWPCVAIEFSTAQLFEQTPGPGAGEPLR
ncbi:MAG TPA: hypothetical protein VFR05_08085 [Terriglobia bacterium]|nr:hypothetical protein [Terriglobia bacterium]